MFPYLLQRFCLCSFLFCRFRYHFFLAFSLLFFFSTNPIGLEAAFSSWHAGAACGTECRVIEAVDIKKSPYRPYGPLQSRDLWPGDGLGPGCQLPILILSYWPGRPGRLRLTGRLPREPASPPAPRRPGSRQWPCLGQERPETAPDRRYPRRRIPACTDHHDSDH